MKWQMAVKEHPGIEKKVLAKLQGKEGGSLAALLRNQITHAKKRG
jgi:hypothetical protein